MPKKFATENTKAVAARDRKKQAKDAAESKKQKEIEDQYWKDDDKQLQKKKQKKVIQHNISFCRFHNVRFLGGR